MQYLAVFIGGGLGSICRYGISRLSIPFFTQFPIHTLIANILSSAILGFLTGFFLSNTSNQIADEWKLLTATGFCGGFSTFSTFSLETFKLFQTQQYFLAILYVLISVMVCVTMVWLGYSLNQVRA